MASAGIRAIGMRAWVGALALVGATELAAGVPPAMSQNPTPVQLFYVPFPENQLLASLQTIESGGPSVAPSNPMQTYISISAIANNTIVYYDQWENGYDADIANPANLYSGGNPGGTQIWGNADAADGAPPGVPGDVINAGTVIVLNNPVDTTNPSAIKFDGRDKFAATKTVAVTRVGWGSGSNTLLAGAVEVFDTDNWGKDHRAPVGENIVDTTDFQMFEYTGLAIMAGEGGATIQIDANANGIFETVQALSEGQGFFVNGGVNVGGRVVSDNPVQVDIVTGDRASNYESRDSSLLPMSLWTNSYYTPVSTAASAQGNSGTATTVWLYNPGADDLTVAYTTRDGGGNLTTTNLVVLGGPSGGFLKQVIPDGYGAHFSAASNFYTFSTTDSTNSATSGGQYPNNQAWDWGFALVPEDSLTPQVLIGLGLGRDPTSGTNPSENGNPVWVTPFGNGDTPVTIYVDYDANPLTGPLTDINGNKYNVSLSLRELERAKIYDPDGNQTGVLVYTLAAGVKLAAAWGQDPLTASASAPGLDVGTGVPPLPLFSAGKNGTLEVDNDGDGFISPGDVLLYTVSIINISRAPVPDVILQDLPPDTTYIPNTTFFTNASMVTTQIPDDGVGTPFPLDGDGVTLDEVTALPVGGAYTVTYQVQIESFANLPPGTTAILNECSASAVGVSLECSDTTPLAGCIGDFVWKDLNGNTLQDGGAETGIASVTVELYLDGNGDGLLDGGDTLLDTETTNGSGLYKFLGVLAGQYIVNVVDASVPSGYSLTTANDPTALTLAGGECRLDVDFGYQPQCVTNADCDDQIFCTDDACVANQCVYTPHVGICRAANGDCDAPESCDGNGVCPPDGNDPDGTACGSPSNTVCDNPDTCLGGVCVPNNEPGTVQCRADAGQCDVAEFCAPGGVCPADGFEQNGTACGSPSDTVCDNPDTCVGGVCVPNNEPGTVQCRADAGQCDVAEFCAPGGVCPPDGFEQDGTACGSPSNTVCDNPDTCVGGVCQPNNEPGTVQCRADAGQCDVAEFCASGGVCPPDGFEPNGTACGSPSNTVCDNPDTCVGGVCQGNNEPTTTVCRPSTAECDADEFCSPTGTCPPDVLLPDGTPCQDGNACTSVDGIEGPDACEDGQCVGIPVDCDDDAVCTDDSCDPGLGCVNIRNPANGPSCSDDHYKCYKTKPVRFQQRDVTLVDQFGPSTARVLKVERFCNPANKNNEGILDPTAHLNCYKIREGAFEQREVILTNQFGEQRVNVVRPDSLCLPAVKDNVGELDDLQVNHFKCYKVRPATPFQAISGVNVVDQFEDKDTAIVKPKYMCTPANKNGEDPTAPLELGHLACFKIKFVRGQTPFFETGADVEDQFVRQDLQGTRRTECRASKLLCVPSLKRLASPSGAFLEETSSIFD